MKATMTPETRFQRSSDVVATDMNGEIVMMHIEKGTYFALAGSGGQIWTALEGRASLSEVADFIRSEYDVSEVEDLDGVIAGFVGRLIEQGLVTHAD